MVQIIMETISFYLKGLLSIAIQFGMQKNNSDPTFFSLETAIGEAII